MGTLSFVNVVLLGLLFLLTLGVSRWSWWASLAIGVGAVILASSSYAGVQERFLTVRWGALAALVITVPLRPPFRRPGRIQLLAGLVVVLVLVSTTWSFDRSLTLQRAIAISLVIWVAFFVLERRLTGPVEARRMTAALAAIPVTLTVSAIVLLFADPATAVLADNLRGLTGGSDQLGLLLGIAWPVLAVTVEARWSSTVAMLLTLLGPVVVLALATARAGIVALLLTIVVYEGRRHAWLRMVTQLVLVLTTVAVFVAINPNIEAQAKPPATSPATAPTSTTPTPPAPTSTKPTQPSAPVVGNKRAQIIGFHKPPQEPLLTALLGGRNEAWRAVVRLTDNRPFTGYGFGTGDHVFGRYPGETHFVYFVGASQKNTTAHSGYLQAFEELGWAGGAVFLLPLLVALATALRGLSRPSAWSDAEWALAAALVGAMFGGIFESIFQSAGGAFSLLVWALAGATLRIAAGAAERVAG